jgi:replicative DNA helicase
VSADFILDAEKSILRHAMIYPHETLPDTTLTANAFSDYRHELMWQHINELWSKNASDKIDSVLLSKASEVEVEYIKSILGYKTVGNDPKVWDSEIRKNSLRKSLSHTLEFLKDDLDETDDPEQFAEEAIMRIQRLSEGVLGKRKGLVGAVEKAVYRAERAYEGDQPGVDVGFESVRRAMGGIPKGVITVLGAKTSIGKTAFAVTCAYNAAKLKQNVGFFTLEDEETNIVNRMIAIDSSLDVQKIKTGELMSDERVRFHSAAANIANLQEHLHVFDDLSGTAEEFMLLCTRLIRTHRLEIIFVDYLQILRGRKSGNRNEDIDKIVIGFKRLAKTMGVAVVLLSQLRRKKDGDSDVPDIEMLRDSGTIEQHSHVILLLHRRDKKASETKLIVGKNKDGPVGSLNIYFEAPYSRYVESSGRYEQEQEQDESEDDGILQG